MVVYVAGELDSDTVRLLIDEFIQLAPYRDGRRRVLLDLSDIAYCDRGGLFTLLGLCNALTMTGVAVGITEPSTVVRTMIAIAGLGTRLPLRDGEGPPPHGD
nr:STAS domain-containing protein [Streptomyces minutiscleroticus]